VQAGNSRVVHGTFKVSGDEIIADFVAPRECYAAGRWSFPRLPRASPSPVGTAEVFMAFARWRRLSPDNRRAPSWSSLHFGVPRSAPAEVRPLSRGIRQVSGGFRLGLHRSGTPVDPSNRPSVGPSARVHSRSPLRASFGLGGATSEVSVRPRGFSPPRRLPPRSACGLVASRCRPWGSPRFSLRFDFDHRPPCGNLPNPNRRFPATQFIPPEDSFDRRRTPSLGPLPS